MFFVGVVFRQWNRVAEQARHQQHSKSLLESTRSRAALLISGSAQSSGGLLFKLAWKAWAAEALNAREVAGRSQARVRRFFASWSRRQATNVLHRTLAAWRRWVTLAQLDSSRAKRHKASVAAGLLLSSLARFSDGVALQAVWTGWVAVSVAACDATEKRRSAAVRVDGLLASWKQSQYDYALHHLLVIWYSAVLRITTARRVVESLELATRNRKAVYILFSRPLVQGELRCCFRSWLCACKHVRKSTAIAIATEAERNSVASLALHAWSRQVLHAAVVHAAVAYRDEGIRTGRMPLLAAIVAAKAEATSASALGAAFRAWGRHAKPRLDDALKQQALKLEPWTGPRNLPSPDLRPDFRLARAADG